MTGWSMDRVVVALHSMMRSKLEASRDAIGHSGTKGDASEGSWITLFNEYLPTRYQSAKGTICDSNGQFSDQIDVVIYDRQYSPLIFVIEGQKIIPAEAVYAVFESKQVINAEYVEYAQDKAETVRALHRTSAEVTHLQGKSEGKEPQHIISGILALNSDWKPAMGDSLREALSKGIGGRHLDLGCIANAGYFDDSADGHRFHEKEFAVTAFLFELVARLQASGTVPMIDMRAYALHVR